MTVYYINLALILGLALPLCIYKPSKPKIILYLAITFGYMWFLATFREGIGNDYYSYIRIFDKVSTAQDLSKLKYEPGFVLLTKGISLFVSSSVMMYSIYALLILLPVAWFIYRHCEDVWLSTWLYVTLAYFYNSMNFIRQSLACSFFILGYDFLRKKKTVPFLIVVLLAASLHKTALIMIPVYFVCHIPLSKKLGIAYASATLVTFLFSVPILDVVTNYIFKSYKGSLYLKYGLSIAFLVIPLSVFIICLSVYPVWKKQAPEASFLLNIMMYNLIFWIFLTRHFIIERFSMYMNILTLIALPWAIRSLLPSPEVTTEYNALALELQKNKKLPKDKQAKLESLARHISDNKKYYWSAVIAVLLVTMAYNEFGMHSNGFHGVFPYQSVLSWIS